MLNSMVWSFLGDKEILFPSFVDLPQDFTKWRTLVLPAGSIPSWLQGTLLRNGPGLFSVGNSQYNHWFDGLSLIHSFTFRNGEESWNADNNQVFCVLLKKLVSLLQVRWPTGASFWRAKPTKRTARPTGLLSPSLERWFIRIPAKTSSPGNGEKKEKKSRLTSVPSNQSQRTDKGVCRQSVYAPLQRHPGLHRQQLDQYHSLWQGLLRQLRDQLHQPDWPRYPGNRGQGNFESPCKGWMMWLKLMTLASFL